MSYYHFSSAESDQSKSDFGPIETEPLWKSLKSVRKAIKSANYELRRSTPPEEGRNLRLCF